MKTLFPFLRKFTPLLNSIQGQALYAVEQGQESPHTIPAKAGIQSITKHFLLDSCFRRNGTSNFRAGSQFYKVESESMILPWGHPSIREVNLELMGVLELAKIYGCPKFYPQIYGYPKFNPQIYGCPKF